VSRQLDEEPCLMLNHLHSYQAYASKVFHLQP
jgi:hypothetical protein